MTKRSGLFGMTGRPACGGAHAHQVTALPPPWGWRDRRVLTPNFPEGRAEVCAGNESLNPHAAEAMPRASYRGGAVAGPPSSGLRMTGACRMVRARCRDEGSAEGRERGAPRLMRAHPETAKLSERRRHRERPPTP